MLEKAKAKAIEVKKTMQEKNLEKKRLKIEQELLEEQRIAEKLKKEAEALQEEKERLMSLDEHEIMAELVFAVRGFYSEYEQMQNVLNRALERIEQLEEDVSELDSELTNLKNSLESNSDY